MNIYLVTGRTYDYDSSRTWNVHAFCTREIADALAARLNAWCLEHGVDNGPSGDAARAVRLEAEEKRQEEFFEAWWATNGKGLSRNSFDTPEENKEEHKRLYGEMWADLPREPSIGTPPEDPGFETRDLGTEYTVETVALD